MAAIPISIRPLRPDEWPTLRDLRIRALADSPDAFGPTVEDARGRSDAYWERTVRSFTDGGGELFAAFDGDRSVALVSGGLDPERVGHVGAMWVDPAVRGTGLGRRMLDAVLASLDARGAFRVELSVTEGNAGAQRLYEAAGFRTTGETEPLREGSSLRNLKMARDATAESG